MTTMTATKASTRTTVPAEAAEMLRKVGAVRTYDVRFRNGYRTECRDVYEVTSGRCRVIIVLDDDYVGWVGYLTGWSIHKLDTLQEYEMDNHKYDDSADPERTRIACVRSALRWLEANA